MVEPPDPFQSGELDIFQPSPGATPPNHFRLERTDHRFGQGALS